MAYASKYYDPVKAHEYYEKNKKLKGDPISAFQLSLIRFQIAPSQPQHLI